MAPWGLYHIVDGGAGPQKACEIFAGATDRGPRSRELARTQAQKAGDTTMAQRLQQLAGHLHVTASTVATETVSDVDLDTL